MTDRARQEALFHERAQGARDAPVECLGTTFESDEARREHFLEKLRVKLSDPAFRKIEGFPIAEDEDILALSDPLNESKRSLGWMYETDRKEGMAKGQLQYVIWTESIYCDCGREILFWHPREPTGPVPEP